MQTDLDRAVQERRDAETWNWPGSWGVVLDLLPAPAFQQVTLCLIGPVFLRGSQGSTGEMLRLH